MKRKRKGFWLKLMGGSPRKTVENQEKRKLCLWRGICAYKGDKSFLMFWAVSCFYCWCFELYHGFVADVLSCIRFPLLMPWALSCFYCWCLELYHAFVADVLSYIRFPLLMSWAVSLCDSGLFNIIYSCLFFELFLK